MKFLQEFKKFAVKGNVVDLAVGIIIGTAFNKIVSSLVNDIVMPSIGVVIGGVDFSDLKIVLREVVLVVDGEVIKNAVTLNYGVFVQTIVDFVIIAMSVFVFVKVINKLKDMQEKTEKEEAKKEPAEDIVLLREIRDQLKNKV